MNDGEVDQASNHVWMHYHDQQLDESPFTPASPVSATTSKKPNATTTTNTRTTASCFEPMNKIIGPGFHNTIPTRVINVGMPKTGSTSLQNLFIQSGQANNNSYQNARHFHCGKDIGPCGACIQKAIENNKPPLASCGNYTVWTQLDYPMYNDCYFPQVSALEEIVKENPDAVLILPLRNVSRWINSINKWGDMRKILTRRCDIPGLKRFEGFYDHHFERFLCGHVENVRKLVKDYPTLTLIEFNIEHDNSGRRLASHLPGLDETFWGASNAGPYYFKGGTKDK